MDRLVEILESGQNQLKAHPLDEDSEKLCTHFIRGLEELRRAQREWYARLGNHEKLQYLTEKLTSGDFTVQTMRDFREEFLRDWRKIIDLVKELKACDDEDRSDFESISTRVQAVFDALEFGPYLDTADTELDEMKAYVTDAFDHANRKLKLRSDQMWQGAGKGLQDLVAQLQPGEEVRP